MENLDSVSHNSSNNVIEEEQHNLDDSTTIPAIIVLPA